MGQRPTKKQHELLNFIDGFIKGNGFGPSYREIMRALGYKSVSTVAVHVDGLITRGWLTKKDSSARSLEVVGIDADAVIDREANSDAEREIRSKIKELRNSKAEDRTQQVEALNRALEILGYRVDDGKELA